MTPAWLATLPDLDVEIPCGGSTHAVGWRQGSLLFHDHDDPEAELALLALGAPTCECLHLARTWQEQAGNLLFLVLADRRGTGGLSLSWDTALRVAAANERARVLSLFCVSPALQQRLQATVIANTEMAMAHDASVLERHHALLTSILHARAEPALRPTALAAVPARRAVVTVRLGPVPDVRARMVGPELHVDASLPWSWLDRVWCRDLATSGGRFVLDAHDDDVVEVEVLEVRESPGGVVTAASTRRSARNSDAS